MERTLEYLLEKDALEQAVIRYCTSTDKLDDLDGMLENFTEDAVFDLTALQLPRFEGHAQIRAFFEQVFADMSHHAHLLTNFRVDRLENNEADVKCYVTGLGRSKSGTQICVYVFYDLTLRKTEKGWKISRFYEAPMLPLPESVVTVHKKD